MRSDIGSMLDKIAAQAEGDATQHARGLVIHGNVQTLILANSVTVDNLQVKADDKAAETTPG